MEFQSARLLAFQLPVCRSPNDPLRGVIRRCQVVIAFSLVGCLTIPGRDAISAEPSFDQTAGYILNIVRAFRTAYVLHVVEHVRDAGLSPREDWKTGAHFLPLPAQFVKEAAEQVEGLEIGLISLTPLNPTNRPRTDAEMTALVQLEKDRQRGIIGFVDGDECKAVSADLALVRSYVDCHNQHPRAVRKNFQQWDVMGALVVRLKRTFEREGQALPPEPPKRAPELDAGPPPPSTITPPWVR